MTPASGWKAYYAMTRAIVNINSEFFDTIRERSTSSMSRLWLNLDYVKCFHASGELCSGYASLSISHICSIICPCVYDVSNLKFKLEKVPYEFSRTCFMPSKSCHAYWQYFKIWVIKYLERHQEDACSFSRRFVN